MKTRQESEIKHLLKRVNLVLAKYGEKTRTVESLEQIIKDTSTAMDDLSIKHGTLLQEHVIDLTALGAKLDECLLKIDDLNKEVKDLKDKDKKLEDDKITILLGNLGCQTEQLIGVYLFDGKCEVIACEIEGMIKNGNSEVKEKLHCLGFSDDTC